MKRASSVKTRCENCYRVVRKGVQFIYCKVNPRHKQRQS